MHLLSSFSLNLPFYEHKKRPSYVLIFLVKNQEIIQDSGGITSLIQQLTQTENEELSKTVKYLLHMCVSSGKLSAKKISSGFAQA